MNFSGLDNLFDKIYAKRLLLIKYFIIAIICSVIKYTATFFISKIAVAGGDILVWTVWAIIFYPALKYFVFKSKMPHIYALMRQIIIYILCIFVLYVANSFILSVLIALTRLPSVALSIGGIITEILCLLLMTNIVFKSKKK